MALGFSGDEQLGCPTVSLPYTQGAVRKKSHMVEDYLKETVHLRKMPFLISFKYDFGLN